MVVEETALVVISAVPLSSSPVKNVSDGAVTFSGGVVIGEDELEERVVVG